MKTKTDECDEIKYENEILRGEYNFYLAGINYELPRGGGLNGLRQYSFDEMMYGMNFTIVGVSHLLHMDFHRSNTPF